MCQYHKQSRWGDSQHHTMINPARHTSASRPSCHTRTWCLILLIAMFCTGGKTQIGNAGLDANSLVRQMVLKYQSVQTLQEVSESRFVDSHGEEFIQTTTLKYKRPNLIYLETHDPKQGTLLTSCNGRLATLYAGKENIYTRRTAAPTFVGILDEVSKASLAMINVPQNQVLSPLSFLVAKRLPVEAANYRYVKTAVIDEKRVALVMGTADPNWLKTLFPAGAQPAFQKREVALWIDLNTKLLVRASFDLIWQATPNGGIAPGRMYFVETHRNVTPNAPLRDEDFNVAPPKGAEEKFPEAR